MADAANIPPEAFNWNWQADNHHTWGYPFSHLADDAPASDEYLPLCLQLSEAVFARNYELAERKFQKAIDEIDKSIYRLRKTQDTLIGTDRNLRLANDKTQDVTIKKLAHANPTMKAKFDALESTS